MRNEQANVGSAAPIESAEREHRSFPLRGGYTAAAQSLT